MDTDLSIVVVNFNAGEYLAGALDSLAVQDLGRLRVETVVVDCASPLDQAPYLAAARARGARVLALDRNPGYGGGCNRGLAETSGSILFFLNADVRAGEACLPPLVHLLETRPEVGFVEPRTFLDPAFHFIVPEIPLPTRRHLLAESLARRSQAFARRSSLRRARRALSYWRAEAPLEVSTLSGAFLGTRREVMERLGGFDEGYPLYYEDTDLFRRARRAGYGLVLFPGARAVHFAHRSVATVWDEAMAKLEQGRRRYVRRHLGPLSLVLLQAWERVSGAARPGGRTPRLSAGTVDLGRRVKAPELEWGGGGGPFLLELALDPGFLLAAGHPGEGAGYTFPGETWDALLPAQYHLRVLDVGRWIELGRWCFEKVR